jgi:amino acid adenylation domain-containing protein
MMSDLDQRIASLSPEKREMLLRRLNKQHSANSAQVAIPRRSPSAQPVPLSFAQESLWLVDQLTPDSAAYNLPCVLRLEGPLNRAALEQTIHQVVQRHETLRTTFQVRESRPVQVIAPTLAIPLEEIDLQQIPEAEREQRAKAQLAAEVARPFDLAQGPLLRAKLLVLAEDQHMLLLLMHHIISDGWSIEVLMREISTLYGTLCAGQPSPLPELPIQYADYALWQRERLQGETLDKLLAYWKGRLAGAPAVLELPTDHPRPNVQSFQGGQISFKLAPALAKSVRALGQQEQTSIFMTLLAAFQALLARYTGREDIVVGSSITNRNRPETEGLIGYLVNMLVLRGDLAGNPSFRDLLRRVRTTTLDAFSNQELPLNHLVEALQPERSLSYNPLFQVVFALENAIPPSVESGGVVWELVELAEVSSKFDLQLTMQEGQESLGGYFIYNADLFEAATVERIAGHWQTLLEEMVTHPDQAIATLPLLTPAERQHVLVDWNATETPYPQDKCVQTLFEEQVARTPDAIAVVYEDTQLTYRELNTRANHLAHSLRGLGVGPESLVALCLERTADMVVGVLGVMKAGGAYVPLDPTYPVDRLAFMLEDSQPAVLVTQQHLRGNLPTENLKVVCLDSDHAHLAQQPGDNPAPRSTPDNLAYVIYTSGSTGKPKGVQVLQRALVNFLLSMGKEPGITAQDRLLAVTTLSFDIAGLELYLPLLVGARVVLVSRETAANGVALAQALEHSRATVMQATPVTWRLLLAAGWQGNPALKVLCGGEPLPPDLATQLLERCGSLWNLYGPTETTVWSTVRQITSADTLITIGHPIANTQVYILDAQLQPVPVGTPGELYIGGDGLARGYLHRPELTAERFIPDPFSSKPEARIYRTGDLARFLPNGELEHLGRLDHQVKVRGFRIELGEIESVLAQHPAVRQAVVIAREDSPGDKRLVAYVIPEEGEQIAYKDLRPFLKEHLPDYMVPAACMMLDSYPQTPNGKIDRKALPAPEAIERAEDEVYVEPTLIEHYQLLEIWEELLDARPIGITDNFFLLGGHSLLAARLIARIEEVFGKKIALATLFAGPTIEELTQALQKQDEETQARVPIYAIQTGGSKLPFFFLHGAWEGGGFYCYRLARDLGPDQPFYALQPYRLEGLHVPPSFEEMAAAHIDVIRAIQPEGPYLLGGFCNGGLIGAEITRQLRAQGQHVALLALVDPSEPAGAFRRTVRNLIRGIGTVARLSEEKQLSLYLRYRHIYASIFYTRGRFGFAIPTLTTLKQPLDKLREEWASVYYWVMPNRVPDFDAEKFVCFWKGQASTQAEVWLRLAEAKGADISTVPGEHLEWRAENIRALADQLSVHLAKVQAVETRQEALIAG